MVAFHSTTLPRSRAAAVEAILAAFDFTPGAIPFPQMTTTETRPRIDEGTQQQPAILPPWSVILHNDDHNDMLHVVRSLIKSVPNLGTTRATKIMLEAHNRGKAIVTTCPLELAELYRERLESFGLTATIEKA
ncbi:MAG TPA: ATP-dependent Clp protease adaptor ClpS [Chloroflexota bacterium]|nr:ATP-dependent Clp protease adaptor ClpS [Chloroflexota bacterium]